MPPQSPLAVLTALSGWDPVVGLVVGSYQGCSEALETLAREAAEAMARSDWKKMGARSEDEALGIFITACAAAGAA